MALGWPALGPDSAALPDGLQAIFAWFGEDQFRQADLLAGPANIFFPQRLLGLTFALIILQAWIVRVHSTRRGALILGAGLGLLAPIEIGVFAVTGTAMAALLLVDAIRATPGHRIQATARLAIALLSALVVAFAIGGPLTDALLRGGGREAVSVSPHLEAALIDPRRFAEPLHPGLYAAALGAGLAAHVRGRGGALVLPSRAGVAGARGRRRDRRRPGAIARLQRS